MPICFVLLMIGGGNMPKTQSAVGIVTSSNSSQIISTSSIDSSMQKVSQEAEKLAKIEADKKVEEERKKDDEAKISAEKKAEEEKKKADESSKSDFTILEDLAKVNKAELWILKNDDSFSNANEGEGNYRIILNLPNFVENCDDAKKTAYYILEKFYTDSKVGNKIFTIRINILRNLNIEMGGKLAQSLTNSKLWSGPTNFWKNIDQTSLVKTLDQKLLSSDSIRASYNQINCKQKDSN
jgi:hypothetical protein